MNMNKKTEFAVMLSNKPGELGRLAALMAKAKVNISGISINDGVHHGVVKFVVDEASPARAALKKANVAFSERQVLALALANKLGALAGICAKLAAKRVNIDYIYGTACACASGDDCSCGCECTLILSVPEGRDLKAVFK
jgi:hypothetical protein